MAPSTRTACVASAETCLCADQMLYASWRASSSTARASSLQSSVMPTLANQKVTSYFFLLLAPKSMQQGGGDDEKMKAGVASNSRQP